MHIGVIILPDERWAQAARRWRKAEQLGFRFGWTYDHLGWRSLVDGTWFDAVPTLAAAAGVTSTLRLGTLVASPNFRHPVHFARELTALDDLSDGRLTLGVGAGSPDFDAAVLGRAPLSARERVDRYAEFLELLDAVLVQDRTTWHGTYYRAEDARSAPGCTQLPRIPFVVAANGPRSLRLAARFGSAWVTTGSRAEDTEQWWQSVADLVHRFEDAMREAGRDPDTVERHLSLDAAPVYSLSSEECFLDGFGRAQRLGFTDVAVHWPRSSAWFVGKESVLEAVAARLTY